MRAFFRLRQWLTRFFVAFGSQGEKNIARHIDEGPLVSQNRNDQDVSAGLLLRRTMLLRYASAGAVAGISASLVDAALFLLPPHRLPVWAFLHVAFLAASVYCCVIGIGGLLAGAVMLSLQSGVAGTNGERIAGEAAAAVDVAVALACLVGISVTLSPFMDRVAHMPTPYQRLFLIGVGGTLISGTWIPIHAMLRKAARARISPRSLHRVLVGFGSVFLPATLALWIRSPNNQTYYALSIALAALVPFLVMVSPRLKMRGRFGLVATATVIVLATLARHADNEAIYLLRISRSLPAVVLRELPVFRRTPELVDLAKHVDAAFAHHTGEASMGADHERVDEPRARPDVLLLTVDTLRADRLENMPNAMEFASHATRFEHAFASAPATVGAMSQLMTGQRQHFLQHVRSLAAPAPFALTTMTVAERMRLTGYDTYAVVGGALFSMFPSLSLGFDRFDEQTRDGMALKGHDVTEAVLTKLRKRSLSPLLIWAHFMDVHDHIARASDRSGGYDLSVVDVDRELQRLFRELDSTQRGRDTLVVLTSDHGEGLGESRLYAHGVGHPRTIAIPLVIRFPGKAPGVVHQTVGHVDVTRTLLSSVGLLAPQVGGRDLARVDEGAGTPPTFATFEYATYALEPNPMEVGIVSFPWFFAYDIRQRTPLLINLESDPDGMSNLGGMGKPEERMLREMLVQTL